jgi:hypothetical protein
MARLLALVNTAMADAGIAIWESKYFYQYWRPVTGIRESDEGTGPHSGRWQSGNCGGYHFFAAWAHRPAISLDQTSRRRFGLSVGHAGFGGALFQTLRNFYLTDQISFTFISDKIQPASLRTITVMFARSSPQFSRLSQAEEENGQSRIYLGIHWRFDKTEGITQGRRVANYVFAHAFEPRSPGH